MHPFERFLQNFIPILEKKLTQANKASWILETTGSQDAADLRSDLDTELKILLSDPVVYRDLLAWNQDPAIKDPLLKRQLNLLLRSFKQNQAPKALLEEISQKEAALAQSYAAFRADFKGKKVSENEIRDILRKEKKVADRKIAWESSKQIGEVLAPQILALVKSRNQLAASLGYSDFFRMQLDLQEVDHSWLLKFLDSFSQESESAYDAIMEEVQNVLSSRYHVPKSELGPWSYSEPFGQEDPLDSEDLDRLVEGVDIAQASIAFYDKMGMDVRSILARSDMYERAGKCQHAFCIHIDKRGDIRTLNNVKSTVKWLETVLHELGHAVYELYFDVRLPWLLKEPPHMIATEAMALLAGRQAYRKNSLLELVGSSVENKERMDKAEGSLKRRQLIFSRWVFVMTFFESELYRNPDQDLNALWWGLVEKYQKIKAPLNRAGKWDWATKYHIGLAPVYYYSYLLGEMFASMLQEASCGGERHFEFASRKTGQFLKEKVFSLGNGMSWSSLVEHAVGKPLGYDIWLKEFC